ncbi:42688_t:CDS:2, partial [Gigaspora margarita]
MRLALSECSTHDLLAKLLLEYTINDNSLYEFAVTDNTSYNNIQSEYAINDILYNDQSELDVIRDFLHNNNQDKYKGRDMMNFESAEHENLIAYNCYHLINKGAKGKELQENQIFLNWDYVMKEVK